MDASESLPPDLEWYRNQIAGHHPSVTRDGIREIGIIKVLNSKLILKVVQDGARGKRELEFYEKVNCDERILSSTNPEIVDSETRKDTQDALIFERALLHQLRTFLPKYFGRRTLKIGGVDKEFFQLEDVVQPFHAPCIMDVKMGRVTYDPTADAKKRLAESSKCACQTIFGFRVLGYQINSKCSEPNFRDRVWGKALDEKNIQKAFEEYLLRGCPAESLTIINQFLVRISEIKQWFERQETFHFYASSLLLIYEGEPANYNNENSTKKTRENSERTSCERHNEDEMRSVSSGKSLVDVRMIDFSHVFPTDRTKDNNYMHGLDYILKIFEKIRDNLINAG